MKPLARPIRLIVADVDGCVTRGGRQPFDLAMMQRIAERNRASRTDPGVPAMTFCTGRPLPYVQALQQACACHHPAIAEFGAVLWDPVHQHHSIHPAYSEADRRRYQAMLAEAEQQFIANGDGQVLIEAGKVCQLTLYPKPPLTVPELARRAESFSARWSEHFATDQTTAVVNYMPHAVNKGTALDWLSRLTGIDLDEMVGLGDSESDWHFMRLCARSAAPSNAVPALRARVDWRLQHAAVDCIEELYERIRAESPAA